MHVAFAMHASEHPALVLDMLPCAAPLEERIPHDAPASRNAGRSPKPAASALAPLFRIRAALLKSAKSFLAGLSWIPLAMAEAPCVAAYLNAAFIQLNALQPTTKIRTLPHSILLPIQPLAAPQFQLSAPIMHSMLQPLSGLARAALLAKGLPTATML